MGQHPPSAAGTQHVANSIDYLQAGIRDRPSAGFGRRQNGFQQLPLLSTEVARIGWSSYTSKLRLPTTGVPVSLMPKFVHFRNRLKAHNDPKTP